MDKNKKELKKIADKVGLLEGQIEVLKRLYRDDALQRNICYRLVKTTDKKNKTFKAYAKEITNKDDSLADWLKGIFKEIILDIRGTKALLICDFFKEIEKYNKLKNDTNNNNRSIRSSSEL